jgi:hypothetical protein
LAFREQNRAIPTSPPWLSDFFAIRVDWARSLLIIFAMISLVRKAFWLAFFVASTISFVVLFEHGTVDFKKNFQTEVNGFVKMMHATPKEKADDSDAGAK